MRVACVVLFAASLSMSPTFPLGLEGEGGGASARPEGAMYVHDALNSYYALPNAIMSMLGKWLAAGQAATVSVVVPSVRNPHVRPLEKDAGQLIAKGMEQSPTFRRLVARLEQSDVVVYVRLAWSLPLHMGGRLHFLSQHGGARYVVVDLDRVLARSALVALLGHELQHAVEVADAGDVTSSAALGMLYRRVGIQTGPDRYDSIAARRAGYDVLREEATSRRHSTRDAVAMRSLTDLAE